MPGNLPKDRMPNSPGNCATPTGTLEQSTSWAHRRASLNASDERPTEEPGEGRRTHATSPRSERLDLTHNTTSNNTFLLNGSLFAPYDEQGARPDPDRVKAWRGALACWLTRHPSAPIQYRTETDSGKELILDDSNLLPFWFLRTGDRLGRAVVKLLRGDGAAGTGFMVAPGVLMTNHHVIPDEKTARTAKVIANYEPEPPPETAGRPLVVPLLPARLFVTSPEMDFTFCAVAGLDSLGVIPLERDSLGVLPSECVNIIQHPRGRPKEIALQDNKVVKVDNVVVQYCCDTEPGSSGSPVFNNSWNLIALHHASVIVPDTEGGRCACGVEGDARFLNEGIRISAISNWLETLQAEQALGYAKAQALRDYFHGYDPQIGFFGALGFPYMGRTAAETVIACYHQLSSRLDIALWNLKKLGSLSEQQTASLARLVASLRVDVWCLLDTRVSLVSRLVDLLKVQYHDEYRLHAEQTTGILWLVREGLDSSTSPGHPESGLLLKHPASGKRKVSRCPVRLVPLPRGRNPRDFSGSSAPPEGLRVKDEDLVLLGDGFNARAQRTIGNAPGCRCIGASRSEGLAYFPSGTSDFHRVFLAPNMSALEPNDPKPPVATVASCRSWPQSIALLGLPLPVAMRLA